MNDAYINIFQVLVTETKEQHGYELPLNVEQYVVVLLADHLTRPDWTPEKSFTETWANIKSARSAKLLGDECLFMCGVFPEYGTRRGVNLDYFESIGSSSYSRASVELNTSLFDSMSQHFKFVSKFINVTVNKK